jgi:hypothetical protein
LQGTESNRRRRQQILSSISQPEPRQTGVDQDVEGERVEPEQAAVGQDVEGERVEPEGEQDAGEQVHGPAANAVDQGHAEDADAGTQQPQGEGENFRFICSSLLNKVYALEI